MRHMLICKDSRPCFAKVKKRGSRECECAILTYNTKEYTYKNEYKAGECPFCKPKAEVTKGKTYPMSEYNEWRCKQTDEQRLRYERARHERARETRSQT